MKKREEKLTLPEKRKRARFHSIKEGIFATAKGSFGDRFIQPFAIAINTSSPMVAIISSISGLLGPLSQLRGSRALEKRSRKKILIGAISLEALMWIPLIVLAFLFYKGLYVATLPLLLLFFFAFFIIFANYGAPAWFSWMGDIVNKNKRGRFFSKRNLLLGFVSVVLAITASYFLDYFKEMNWTMYGFMVLFGLAIVMEIFRLKSFKQQYEPRLKLEKGYYFSFWKFLKNSPKNNFGRLSIYRFVLTLVNTIPTSLLAVYLLRHLELSYFMYMLIILAGTMISLLFIELLGKFADKYGNYRLIGISSIMMIFLPMLWVVNSNPLYLILVPSTISGLAWAGFHLSEGNFIYDNVSQSKRGIAITYYNLFWGAGIFLGGLIGAGLIKYLNTAWVEPIILIFILGTILRFFVVAFGIRKIKEIRHTSPFKGIQSIEDLVLKEAGHTIHQEFREVMHIGKYLKSK